MRIGARSTQLIEIYPFTKSFFFTHIIDASVYIYNSYGGGRYGEDLSGSD
jgi:hypothetical protein